jgi:hypothetical protein
LFSGGLVHFSTIRRPRAGMKGDEQVPRPIVRIRRRHVQRVALRRIGFALDVVDDNSTPEILSGCRRSDPDHRDERENRCAV